MNALLTFAHGIDRLNEAVGHFVLWTVPAATFIASAAALMRYGLGEGSNAWLELQWYLFAAMVLLGAGYTLRHHGHVRIDILYGLLTPRGRAWLDVAGGLLFLLPFAGLMVWLSWPLFIDAWRIGEISADAGGLTRWPVKLLLPLGFALLFLQGLAEIIKRAAMACGILPIPDDTPGSAA
jgi:TRAP-type mannitol/chloroaromatic compound transport system permease small subunit